MMVGYRLFRYSLWAKLLHRSIIGAFECSFNKVSEFMYKPVEQVHGFAIKKENFREILKDKIGQSLEQSLK